MGLKVEESNTSNSSWWIKYLLCIWKSLLLGFCFPFPEFSGAEVCTEPLPCCLFKMIIPRCWVLFNDFPALISEAKSWRTRVAQGTSSAAKASHALPEPIFHHQKQLLCDIIQYILKKNKLFSRFFLFSGSSESQFCLMLWPTLATQREHLSHNLSPN